MEKDNLDKAISNNVLEVEDFYGKWVTTRDDFSNVTITICKDSVSYLVTYQDGRQDEADFQVDSMIIMGGGGRLVVTGKGQQLMELIGEEWRGYNYISEECYINFKIINGKLNYEFIKEK